MQTALPKKTGTPDVKKHRSFLEIAENFTDPKELLREAISNALDWGADHITIRVSEDPTRNRELIIRMRDNGQGLSEERFEAFWNLADSPGLTYDDSGKKAGTRIGEKGHGTKTYWKCRELEVESVCHQTDGKSWHVVGVMTEPINTLRQGRVPKYEYAAEVTDSAETFTQVTIKGYQVQSKEDFRHEVLKDYIQWFTKFGSVERAFGNSQNQDKALELQGLGRGAPEPIPFGHSFPPVSNNINELKADYQDDWPRHFVMKKMFKEQLIPDYPGRTFDFLFYLEGDSAKLYNPMLRRRGRQRIPRDYTVAERYGLYPCKDFIPLPPSERVNDWISEKTEWTLYHAFVNCQDFQLTANRASIGNTDRDFLDKVRQAVQSLFDQKIANSDEYKAYLDEIDRTKAQSGIQQTRGQEVKDLDTRFQQAQRKRMAQYQLAIPQSVRLMEPREEAEVLSLFSIVSAIRPDLFEFTLLDYSTRRGIDALCELHPASGGLTKGNVRYVEFKKALTRDLGNHTFGNLTGIVCWECNLPDGTEVEDAAGEKRVLRITSKKEGATDYILQPPPSVAANSIKVYVLKDYLPVTLGIQFIARTRH